LGVEDHSLAAKENTTGTWWKKIICVSKLYGGWIFGVVVSDESSAQVTILLLKNDSLHNLNLQHYGCNSKTWIAINISKAMW